MSENQFPRDSSENNPSPKPPEFKKPVEPVHPFGSFGQQALPNSTPVLVLGILAILSCCCYGLPGLILGIIGLVLGNKDLKLFKQNPGLYTESSYKNSKAGRICAIIALILSALFVIIMIGLIAVLGWATIQNPEELKRVLEEMGKK
ncbi:CCC motif membrane protein [Pedobacter sp. PWIIR3]